MCAGEEGLDEQYGTWFWEAKGSGIWLFLGRTLVLTQPTPSWPAVLLAESTVGVRRLRDRLSQVDTVQCPDTAPIFGSAMPNSRFEIVVLPTRDARGLIVGGLPGKPPKKCHVPYRAGWNHSQSCQCVEAAPFLRCGNGTPL